MMKNFRNRFCILLSLVMVFVMTGCAGNETAGGGDSGAGENGGVNLKDMLTELYVSEEQLDLSDRYTSTEDIPDTFIDPELAGTWKTADGSTSYTYREDGTATFSAELYGDNESTFTCFVSKGYNIIASDLEMIDYSDEEEKTIPVVTYESYKIDNDALYFTAVESLDEYASQSITQIVVLYKADENGDISESLSRNPVAAESFYGEWTCSDEEESRFTIDANGFTPEGGKTLPVTVSEKGRLVIGNSDDSTEYSAAIALERLYDSTEGQKVTGENFVLGIFYTGRDEKDRPNLADLMEDWHAAYGYERFYFSLNAKTPLN